MTIPDEAVQAAIAHYSEGGCMGLDENERREVTEAMLYAALPFLQGVEAEPVAWSIIFSDHYGVNCDTTFKTKQAAEKYVSLCERGKIVPLYLAPSQRAQALEEGFRKGAEAAAKLIERGCKDMLHGKGECQFPGNCSLEDAAAIRALSSQPVADGWLPIETAPKDGTFILLAGPSGYSTTPLRVEVARYYPEYRPLNPWQTHSNDAFTDGGGAPTHWRPLPASPNGGSDADA